MATAPTHKTDDGKPLWRDDCHRCGGSGRMPFPGVFGGTCFACKGDGGKFYRTSPEARENGKTKRAAARAVKGCRPGARAPGSSPRRGDRRGRGTGS